MLKDKVAVIYGAGGAIGGAVARALAREGANLTFRENHLTIVGRHPPGTGLVLIISRRSARACCEGA
jgi:NAD(P)-dependent dehydrogenase (short-subunit alcohol dehydrogenase family)